MKHLKTISLIIGALCLLATVNSQCVTLYSRYNKQGSRLQRCNSGNLPDDWDDRVSSFVVAPGYTVSLYEDSDFGGQEYGPYNAGTYNVPSNFDNEASSIRIIAASKCPIFYGDYNQQGNSFQQCISGDLPSNWNDQISSFVVPSGYTVQLYTDFSYGGQLVGAYSAGSYNIPQQYNDQVSSIRVFAASKCPTFYGDYNQGGGSFQQCTSGDVPSNWNDQISSFVVPQGYTIQLFGDSNYGNQISDAYNAGTYNLPSQYNDQVSSIKVFAVSKCPVFYTDYNQQGNSIQVCTSGNAPSNFNDQISSIVVAPGYSITFYTDYNYGGQSFGPYRSGSYNLPSQYNDQISSYKLFIV